MTYFVALDVETSGLSPAKGGRIIEIALVGIDPYGNKEWSWHSLVNPDGTKVGKTSIHGIKPQDVKHAPTFGQIAGRVQQLLTDRIIIAHNQEFDMKFLEDEFKRLGVTTGFATACTMQGARSAGIYPTKLSDVAAYYGLSNGGAHQAIHDTMLVADIWSIFIDSMSPASTRALAAASHDPMTMVPVDVVDGFHREHALALA
jgi:DNA polymerase-3 subunit epsilon